MATGSVITAERKKFKGIIRAEIRALQRRLEQMLAYDEKHPEKQLLKQDDLVGKTFSARIAILKLVQYFDHRLEDVTFRVL